MQLIGPKSVKKNHIRHTNQFLVYFVEVCVRLLKEDTQQKSNTNINKRRKKGLWRISFYFASISPDESHI